MARKRRRRRRRRRKRPVFISVSGEVKELLVVARAVVLWGVYSGKERELLVVVVLGGGDSRSGSWERERG